MYGGGSSGKIVPGAGVGEAVLGALVGLNDGSAVGARDGVGIGARDGWNVGSADGERVGVVTGVAVGRWVGAGLGGGGGPASTCTRLSRDDSAVVVGACLGGRAGLVVA